MAVYVGSTAITAAYLGSTAVQNIYLGSTNVWSAGAHYSDDFNRADAGDLGANWTTRGATIGITSNTCKAKSGVNWASATWNSVMNTDYHKATVTCVSGISTYGVGLIIASGTDIILKGTANSTATNISTGTSWTTTGTSRAGPSAPGIANGDVLEFSRAPGTTLFTLKINGTTAQSWDDTGGIMPIDSSHRMVGIMMRYVSGGGPASDNWSADDL